METYKVRQGVYFKIAPFQEESGTGVVIATMPLQSNVPEGHPGWELRTCPVCGRKCWYEADSMRFIEIMASGADLRLRCTECARKEI